MMDTNDKKRLLPRKRAVLSGIFALFLLGICAISYVYHSCVQNTRKRMEAIMPYVLQSAGKHGLDPALVMAVIWRESRYRPNIRGKAGEIGLMQVMPIAAEEWKNRTKALRIPSQSQLFSPETNIEVGCWYLAWCGKHWDGYRSKTVLLLTEYNAGYKRASAWKPGNPNQAFTTADIKIASTKKYVETILKKRDELKKTVFADK